MQSWRLTNPRKRKQAVVTQILMLCGSGRADGVSTLLCGHLHANKPLFFVLPAGDTVYDVRQLGCPAPLGLSECASGDDEVRAFSATGGASRSLW
jgi:hypothetical protein